MAGSSLPAFCLDYRKYTVEMISEPTAAIIKKVRQQIDEVASVPNDKVSDEQGFRKCIAGLAGDYICEHIWRMVVMNIMKTIFLCLCVR